MLWFHRRLPCLCAAVALAAGTVARADEPLDVEAFTRMVLRSHPGARVATALDSAAEAEHTAGRLLPDPSVAFSWDRATSTEGSPAQGNENGFSVSQSLPWPGTLAATARAGARAAEALHAEGAGTRWNLEIDARVAFARALHARAALAIAEAAEADARALRELTATRAELGEAREVDRIKAEVEWLRQQRARGTQEREADTAASALRRLAGEALPGPLALRGELPGPLPSTEAGRLAERLGRLNPRLLAAAGIARRDAALLSASRRARIPDLDVRWFRDEELDKTANGFSIGLRVPLWNANRGAIARAGAASSLALATAERTRLELETALDEACKGLDVASAQADILEGQLLPSATRSLELARFSYREGETSLLDLLDAQRTFRETQREALASRLAVALALADLQRLVGPDFIPGGEER